MYDCESYATCLFYVEIILTQFFLVEIQISRRHSRTLHLYEL